jgi:hypothetical protein
MASYNFFDIESFTTETLTTACKRVGNNFANAAKDIPGLIVAGVIVLHKDGNATPLLTLRKAFRDEDASLMDRYIGAMSGKTNGGKALVTYDKAKGIYEWPKGFRAMSLNTGALDTLASFHGRAAFNAKAVREAMLPTQTKVVDWDDLESAILKTIASKMDKATKEGITLNVEQRADLRRKVSAAVEKALAGTVADHPSESDVVEGAAAAA